MATKRKAPKAKRPDFLGYGIAGGKKGLLPWSWAERRLKSARQYLLVTVRPSKAPHAMPIWGIWVEGAFYFSSGPKSVKARNLAKNAQCIVSIEQNEEAVVVEGTAREITSKDTRRKLDVTYYRKYRYHLDPNLGPLFAVKPSAVFGLDEKRFTQTATKWVF